MPTAAVEAAAPSIETNLEDAQRLAAAEVDPPWPAARGTLLGSDSADPLGRVSSVFFTANDGQLQNGNVRYYSPWGEPRFGFGVSSIVVVTREPRAGESATQWAPAAGEPKPEALEAREATHAALTRITFPGARLVEPEARGLLPWRSNFFLGNDPSGWRTNVPSFQEILYPQLYPGIDLVYRASDSGVKYDFVVSPGGDPRDIALRFQGARTLGIGSAGQLLVRGAIGGFADAPPVALQGDSRVDCPFTLGDSSTVGFDCGSYDRTRTLVIDPLVYSTYLGGSGSESSWGAIAADEDGDAFVTGQTGGSSDFPNTTGAFSTTPNDGFVARLNENGTDLVYATFLGGSSQDVLWSIDVDDDGNAYVSGFTSSNDFPTTAGALDRTYAGPSDAFVVKLNGTGSDLIFGTYIGAAGEDYAFLSVGDDGSVYLAGYWGSNLVATPGSFDTTQNGGDDAWVAKLNASGASLDYLGFLGGSGDDWGFGITSDEEGNAYVIGGSSSTDFPATFGAFDTILNGSQDAFAAKINPSGSAVVYATLLGGSGSEEVRRNSRGAVDSDGLLHVMGDTDSSDFPTTPGAFSTTMTGTRDVFVVKLNETGSDLVYSTYLGGNGSEYGNSLALDALGRAVVVGNAGSEFPTTNDSFNYSGGSSDMFLTVVEGDGSHLKYSTFFGGEDRDVARSIAIDALGNALVVGSTRSQQFTVTGGAFDSSLKGSSDYFVAKLDLGNLSNLSRYNLTVDTRPTGLLVRVGASLRTAPFIYSCWEGTTRLVEAVTPQFGAPLTRHLFSNWSDGGSAAHRLPCSGNLTVVAFFDQEFEFNIRPTVPAGLNVTVDGFSFTGNRTYWWPEGSTHTVSAPSPQERGQVRYAFADWSDGGAATHFVTAIAPLNLTATFVPSEYVVSISTSPPGLEVVVDGETSRAPEDLWWPVGSPHTVDAPSLQQASPDVRYAFVAWSDTGARNHTVQANAPGFTLVATYATEFRVQFAATPQDFPVRVDGVETETPAEFWWREGSSHTFDAPATAQDGPDGVSRYTLSSWSDGGSVSRTVTAAGPAEYTARFTPSAYFVTVDSDPPGLSVRIGGVEHVAPYSFWWTADASVSLDVESPQERDATRYVFSFWSEGGAQDHDQMVTGPQTFVAFFNVDYKAVLNTDPPGQQLLVDGSPQLSPITLWWPEGSSHTVALRIQQVLGAGVRLSFVEWSDGRTGNLSVTADGPLTLTALFTREYQVNALSLYGEVRCDTPDCWFAEGAAAHAEVDTTVAGEEGTRYLFERWSGDATGTSGRLALTMDGPKEVQAEWKTQHYLTVTSEYGEVAGEGWYDLLTTAPFSVSPLEVAVEGTTYRFTGWGGDADAHRADSEILMNAPKTVVGQWEEVVPAAGFDVGAVLVPLLAVAAAAGAGVFLLARRRASKGGQEPETAGGGKPPATDTAEPSPAGDESVPSAGMANGLAPCPECGVGVVLGSVRCPSCGLEVVWS